MSLPDNFIKIYADLPINLRKEIVVILDKEPYTWNAVFVEVQNKTGRAKELLKKMKEMNIL